MQGTKAGRTSAPSKKDTVPEERVILAPPPLFPVGEIHFTPGARALFKRREENPFDYLHRHMIGDWSEMDPADWEENRLAVDKRLRVFSAYHLTTGEKFWIITEADRQSTTFLLPEEY